MEREQNLDGYRVMVDDFLDSVYEASRMAVLEGFEELAHQVAENLEEFHGYEDIDLNHKGPMAQTFAGPVMDGLPMDNFRSYRISGEVEAEFEINVRDTSMAFMSSGEGLEVDTEK